jgi:hypothetical protein
MLQETRDTLADRKQHIYYYAYVDDRILFVYERGSPVLQGCHICEKAIVPRALDRQTSGYSHAAITG